MEYSLETKQAAMRFAMLAANAAWREQNPCGKCHGTGLTKKRTACICTTKQPFSNKDLLELPMIHFRE